MVPKFVLNTRGRLRSGQWQSKLGSGSPAATTSDAPATVRARRTSGAGTSKTTLPPCFATAGGQTRDAPRAPEAAAADLRAPLALRDAPGDRRPVALLPRPGTR